MQYEITYAQSALRSLRKLDRVVARRVLHVIDGLSRNPRPDGCIRLKGGNGELRVRVGDYRIIYDVIDDEVMVLVLAVGHRREVYR